MITIQEFAALISDPAKTLEGNLSWRDDKRRPSSFVFRVPVSSSGGYPLEVFGRWSPSSGKLSYLLLYGGIGRIYGLDMGDRHRNPSGEVLEGTHKHRWTAEFGDGQAYVPSDITAPWDDPVEVWEQFCAETGIIHLGRLDHPGMN